MLNVPPPVNRQSRSGVALVITLILLSVTLVMAIAFLAVARRERNAVTTTSDTTTARLAADTALAAAQAQIAANALSGGAGAYNYGLLVSTNYINVAGFATGVAAVTNVNYDYLNNGGPLAANDLIQNVANLYFLPRAPVFITNPNNGVTDFRFYLDLNRNSQFDTNGQVAEVDGTGAQTGNTNTEVGDPEWVGILEHPDQPHGPNNKFIARYAFIAQPIGNSLDLNAIHNQTLNTGLGIANDGYFRNEGVGSWELNLAAFLADLNTNQWLPVDPAGPSSGGFYQYNTPSGSGSVNSGIAFNDAFSLINWRYSTNYTSLAFAPLNVQAVAGSGQIDTYTVGNLMTTTLLPGTAIPSVANWAGSDNPNRFYSLMSDIYDPNKSSPNFVNRLNTAGAGPATYDRYTYYRLLNEMGTDTAPDDNRMNLNYDNLDANGKVIPGAETNAIAWTPIRFFTFAADRLLQHYTAKWIYNPSQPNLPNPNFVATFNVNNAFGITNIPVLVSNQFVYTPAVNRLLQLAANMYDATTTNFYPSVFKPIFTVAQDGPYRDVFITGYTYIPSVIGTGDNNFLTPSDAAVVASANLGPVGPLVNIYGVPWILGAKKGLPGFDQFYMVNAMQVWRKLQVTKPVFGAPISSFQTNQQYWFSISNSLGCSLWNSYASPYVPQSGNISIVANDYLTMVLTNDAAGFAPIGYNKFPVTNVLLNYSSSWPGTIWGGSPPATVLDSYNNSFIIPFNLPFNFMTNAIYRYGGYAGPNPYFDVLSGWQLNVNTPALPHFGLLTTNRLQMFILDGTHILDYVQLAGPTRNIDLSGTLADPAAQDGNGNYYLWSTNPISVGNPSGTPWGVPNQINVSRGHATPVNANLNFWSPPQNLPNLGWKTPQQEIQAEQLFFDAFFNDNRFQYGTYNFNGHHTNAELAVQAPYTPVRLIYDYESWQVNDPLVHYLASDLSYANPGTTGIQKSDDPSAALSSLNVNLYNVPTRWSPWGQNYFFANGASTDAWLTQLKDPLLWRPDNWDFPNGKYPSIGWLGRVHRGTPWQTVYLKASDVLSYSDGTGNNGFNTWAQWTGDSQTAFGWYFDATNSAPVQDSDLFDLFSTTLNGNATRGTLSVNQTGLAAWSAVFSGIVALTNASPDYNGYIPSPLVTNTIISPAGPAGNNSPLGQLVNAINSARTNLINADGVNGAFEHVGDILRVPALTEQSPFLNWNDNLQQQYGISDEVYEWLPQQTLGLLRASSSPRYVIYVIYCYGQTLRPAVNGEVLNGSAFGLYTNYQITAETAARVVLRLVPHATATGTNYQSVIESFNPLPPN
jgi:hypothetical protein